MDEQQWLIRIDGKDRTRDIENFNRKENRIVIRFSANPSQGYPYQESRVYILRDPQRIDCENALVFHMDKLLSGVRSMLNFQGTVKIFFKSPKLPAIVPLSDLQVRENAALRANAAKVLAYWRAIAPQIKQEGEEKYEKTFLEREFDKLQFIHPDSVLGLYLNRQAPSKETSEAGPPIFPFRFNLSQRQAAVNAISEQVSVIEGPPGTGKTQTILNILANLAIMHNKTVAVVAGNNAAVQNIEEKLTKEGCGFLVASLGNEGKKQVFFERLPEPNVSGWESSMDEQQAAAQLRKLDARLTETLRRENRIRIARQELSALRLEQRHFQHYNEGQEKYSQNVPAFYRQSPEKIISFLAETQLAKELRKENSLLFKVKLLFKYGYSTRKLQKENGIDLVLALQAEYYRLKIMQLEEEIRNLERQQEKESFAEQIEQHEALSLQWFRLRLFHKYSGKPPCSLTASTFKNEFKTFTEHYPIVLSTTHSLRTCIPEHFLFDYLIVDESWQVDLLSGALALSCCKRAVIVGDMKQLPQVVNTKLASTNPHPEGQEEFDYFRHNLLSSVLAVYPDITRVMLKEHYRCHPKIIGFCNQKYYNGQLIPFTAEKEEDGALVLCRTAPGNHMRDITIPGRKGKYNQRELDVIVKEILQRPDLCEQVYSDIGFVTPFRKQVEKASSSLDEDIECDTVHKYQGREKPIMILSTVLDLKRSSRRVLSFVDDPCLLNVAVSRAQKQFILVTHHSLFQKEGKEIVDLIRYMEYNTLDRNLLESELISVFDLLYRDYSVKLHALRNRLIYKTRYKSETIMYTLLSGILEEPVYRGLTCSVQIYLKDLVQVDDRLTMEEKSYIRNNASVDFVIYRNLNKEPILAIEVDGVSYHEDNAVQEERDKKKESILNKYSMPLLRFKTNGSGEEEEIRRKLDRLLVRAD